MLQLYVKVGVLEYYDKLYRNSWFLVKKKCGKYYIVNTAMNINQYIIHNANLPPSVEEFVKRSARMAIALLVDFYSGYNQVELYPELRDMTAF